MPLSLFDQTSNHSLEKTCCSPRPTASPTIRPTTCEELGFYVIDGTCTNFLPKADAEYRTLLDCCEDNPVIMMVIVDGVEQEKQTCQYLDKCATPEPTEKPVST